jgi:hypothetical protein
VPESNRHSRVIPQVTRAFLAVRSAADAHFLEHIARWLASAGQYRFRGGLYLEGAVVRFVEDTDTTIVPVMDLERFIF